MVPSGSDGGRVLDRFQVAFDEERLVANAGLLLPALLAQRLDLERLVDETIALGARPGAARPGRKLLTLVHAMQAGADSIDDAEVLRSGETACVLGHQVMASSTIGTFLRSFTFGHVRQLDRVLSEVSARAWRAGLAPSGRLVVDLDSTVREVHSAHKQGARFGYTRKLGLHPLLAVRADTGEILHARLRHGAANTQRGGVRFLQELCGRLARQGHRGRILVRADSGFWAKTIVEVLECHGADWSIGVRLRPDVRRAIEAICEQQWRPLADYPPSGEAAIAETRLGSWRLIVRRVRTIYAQQELVPGWEYYPVLTNRDDALAVVEGEHRAHASVELVLRDLKNAALRHLPSGRFTANAAWLAIACLSHNLLRWTSLLAGAPLLRAAATLRRSLIAVPGRLCRHARSLSLRLPARWPWQARFLAGLAALRALPPPA
jgi:hypothetical protein